MEDTFQNGVILGLCLHLLLIPVSLYFNGTPLTVLMVLWVIQWIYMLPAIVTLLVQGRIAMLKGLLVIAGLTFLVSGLTCGGVLKDFRRW
jgi:hypothetical protein